MATEQMVAIKKELAGSDSFGNEWPHDGAVIQVPVSQAHALLAIKYSGCSEVPASELAEDGGDESGGGKHEAPDPAKTTTRKTAAKS